MSEATAEQSVDTSATLSAALTASDRCDQCGAQALYSAFRPHALSIPELLFCGHHGAKAAPALLLKGWIVAQ